MTGRGPRDEARRLLDDADAATRRSDDAAAAARYRAALGALIDADDGEARALRGRGHAGLASIARANGNVGEARAIVEAGEAEVAGADPSDDARLARVELAIAAAEIGAGSPAGIDAGRRAVAEAGALVQNPIGANVSARAWQALGNAHRAAGAYDKAEIDLRAALDAATGTGEADDLVLAGLLNDLAVVLKFSGRFGEAIGLYERVRSIQDAEGLAETADRATLLHNLGGVLHSAGRDADAIDPARQAVELHARTLGADHLATDLDRVALAAILDRLGDADEAEALLYEALPRLRARLGADPEVAVALGNLGAIRQRRGDLAGAEALYREAIAIREATAGPSSAGLAIPLNNLATVVRRSGRPAEAVRLYRRALGLLLEAVEPDHPTIRALERNLGLALDESRD